MYESTRHHVLWQRRDYHTQLEKALRNHTGLVVPLYDAVHRKLHIEVPPPPKPNSRLILGALAMLDELPNSTLAKPPETVLALSEHFLDQDDRLAQRLGHHLLNQSAYIQEGYYDK